MNEAKQGPTVLDVGKRKSKDIQRLKKGEGKLFEKLQAAVAQASVGLPAGKEVVPVVVLYRKRDRTKKKGLAVLNPF